ncbi:MAG TPA: DnaB-like helicase C-terminal domain-containing protein [Rhodocyclaceae bacterium]
MNHNEPIKLFISYSHKDEGLRKELNVHLSPLIRENIATVWFDRKIDVGSQWESAISTELERAEVIVLLISPDFFASDYCFGKELTVALEKHTQKAAIVVPVIVRPVDWTHSKLGAIQAVPKDAIPITLSDNRDAAWLSVIDGIRSACSQATEGRERSQVLNQDSPLSIAEVLGEVVDDLQQLYDSSDPSPMSGLPTGLHDLDALTDGIHPGEVTVIASAPTMDREGLLIRIASHVAVSLRIPVAFVCAQLDRKYVVNRMLASVSSIPLGLLRRGMLGDEHWDRMTVGLAKMHDSSLHFVPAAKTSVSDLLKSLDQLAEKLGALPLIVIDSIAHFEEDKASALHALREFVSHRQRSLIAGVGLENDPGERVDSRPLIQDVGRWASVNEDVDCLMLLYSDQAYHPETKDIGIRELIVARARSGPTGTVKLAYIADYQRFDSLAN